ncbi:tetratricopeptide repeat protein [candidate division GN15 bacterium]|nr:tetratricopeptide repeat protein [candidate division GN15 bacterium]
MAKRILWLLLLVPVVISFGVEADAQTRREAFDQANRLFQDGRYDSAIVLYERILADRVESASLYFNLGNAYFKQGDIGRAVLNYLRAERLDPRDDDISANLEFARGYTRVQMEGVKLNPISGVIESIIDPVRLNTLAWISSLLFIAFFVLLSLRYGLDFRDAWLRRSAVLILVLLIAASLLTTYKYRHDYLTRRAVLTCDQCPVYIGPSEDLDVELQGAPGLVVEIVDQSGDWYNVLFENKRRGWIRSDLVAEV